METRRAFLAVGAGGFAALAGCTALGDGDDSATGASTSTGTPGMLGGHPAATGLRDQPALGPDPRRRRRSSSRSRTPPVRSVAGSSGTRFPS